MLILLSGQDPVFSMFVHGKIMRHLRTWLWWDVIPKCASLVPITCVHCCGEPISLAHRCRRMTWQVGWIGYSAGVGKHLCVYDRRLPSYSPQWLPSAMRTLPSPVSMSHEASTLSLFPESWILQLCWTSFSSLNMKPDLLGLCLEHCPPPPAFLKFTFVLFPLLIPTIFPGFSLNIPFSKYPSQAP